MQGKQEKKPAKHLLWNVLSVSQNIDTVADMADFPNIHFSSSVVGVKLNFIFSSPSYYTYSHRDKFSPIIGRRRATSKPTDLFPTCFPFYD